MLVKNIRILMVLLSATAVWSSLTVFADDKTKDHAEGEGGDEGKLETVKTQIRSADVGADALGKIFRGWQKDMNATKFGKLVKSSGVSEEKAAKLTAAFKAAPNPELFLQGVGIALAEIGPALPSPSPNDKANAATGDEKGGKEGKGAVDPKQKLVDDALKKLGEEQDKKEKAAQAQQDRLFSAFRNGDGEGRGGRGGEGGGRGGEGAGKGGPPPGKGGGAGGEGFPGLGGPPPDDTAKNIGKALSKLHDESPKNSSSENNNKRANRGATDNGSSESSRDKKDRDEDKGRDRERSSKSDEDSKLASMLKDLEKKDSKAEATKKEEEAKAAAAAKAQADQLAANAAPETSGAGLGLNGQPMQRKKAFAGGPKSPLAEISNPPAGFNPPTFDNLANGGGGAGPSGPSPGPAGLGGLSGATVSGAPVVAGNGGAGGGGFQGFAGGGMAYNYGGGGGMAFKRIDNIYQGGAGGGGSSSSSDNDSGDNENGATEAAKNNRPIPAIQQIFYSASSDNKGPTNILMQNLGKQLVTVCRNEDAAKVGICERVPSHLLKDNRSGSGPLMMQGRI